MNGQKKPRILLAPLDWGLGHATRCIPIIRYLLEKDCEVVLASSGAPASLLTKEFSGIGIRELEGYGIRYNSGSSLFGSMVLQLPGIFKSIKKEHHWLNELLKKETFDFIISDNRPCFWNKQVHCIYITHQLLIHSGKGKRVNRLLQQLHARYMKNFNSVWVPDLEGNRNLAGELSHPAKPIIQPAYLGLLSRFEKGKTVEPIYDLLILLSGPEPQRTIFEQKLYHQLQSYNGKILFVRGLPQQNQTSLPFYKHITVHDHLPAHALQEAMASAQLIICRSGYTTLMDLIRLNKKAILIPTPKQPEQEYLAAYMQEQQYFPFVKQDVFDLQSVLQLSTSFSYLQTFTGDDFELYKNVIDKLLESKLHN